MNQSLDPILAPYPPPEFCRFVELFNEQEYFEAHEILEDLWVMTPGEEREFYKGLIMLAVGLLHAHDKRRRGAVGVLTGALEHLQKYPASYGGLDREQGVAVAQAILDGAAFPRKAPLIRMRSA